MSLTDDLTSIQRCLDELDRALGRLEPRLGRSNGLELRRVRTDASHLRESLALLRESAPPERSREPSLPVVPVPDAPYDASLWQGADDEGLGSCDRRAP
ncbi:hypothetical protein AB0K09_31015 [Streptomyces sp. NPDC049577]|uniref:hypothetical protein n=1 Tax=Streptomyces sp. NPDC049577 TaxID=3155153 RepID=UPI003422941C